MQATEWNHRGPMPPYPAKVDIVTWLEMSSEERTLHLRRHAEKEGHSEAATDRLVQYWDRLAALVTMDGQERAGQIRRMMEQAWARSPADEIERQSERWITSMDGIAAAAQRRREGSRDAR